MADAIIAPQIEVSDMGMGIDFRGRLNKIRAPIPRSLQAVFEAVANAFDATAHLGESGRIKVRMLYEPVKELAFEGDYPQYALSGFEIEDNGLGFTDEHIKYFQQSDTTNKPGGKGVGRFYWLKVFNRAEICSIYQQNGFLWKRSFTFSVEKDGVEDKDTAPQRLERSEPTGTKVRLISPKPERVSTLTVPPATLAEKLLEHFLLYFTVLKGQSLTVADNRNNEEIAVGDLYEQVIGGRHKEEVFSINNHQFVLHHLLVKPTTIRKNYIYLCANYRVVTNELVSAWVQEVGCATSVTTEKLRYHGYVTGDYLDDNADTERTGIKFAEEGERKDEDELQFEEESDQQQQEGIAKREFFDNVAIKIRHHLAADIAEVRGKKERQLENFAAQEQPQFRPFVETAKRNLDRLGAKPSKRQIELALYEAKIDGRQELERLVTEIIDQRPSLGQIEDYRKTLIGKFAQSANSFNLSALAEYVCGRKAVIQVLKANLGKNEADQNQIEYAIHNRPFPK